MSEVLKTSGKADEPQYLRLQMRYNIDGSNVFVAYWNASLADSEDDMNWRNARASEKACTTCVKRKIHAFAGSLTYMAMSTSGHAYGARSVACGAQ